MSVLRKLVLIGNFLPDRQESMQRFARVFSDGFAARGLPVETWQPEPGFVKWVSHYRYGGVPKYLGYLDKFVRFPRTLRRRLRRAPPGTAYHIVDHGNAVYAPHFRAAAAPLLVTVHDLLQIRSALGEFPQNGLGRGGRRYQQWILKNLRTLRLAACVSAKTRDDLHRLTGLTAAATPVVLNGLNYPYRPMPREEAAPLLAAALAKQNLRLPTAATTASATTSAPRAGVPLSQLSTLNSQPSAPSSSPRTPPSTLHPPPASESFLFGLGGAQWYKNRTGLIAIYAELRRLLPQPPALLYLGPPFDPAQEALIAEHGLRDSIVHVANLSNEELRATYSLAEGFIFPSWEEGFGWPIAEAQACGCPVFTTNRAPMTEVGGRAARYFDPAQPAAAAAVVAAGIADPGPLRAAGLIEARRWDTQHMLDAYAELYSLLLTETANVSSSSRAP